MVSRVDLPVSFDFTRELKLIARSVVIPLIREGITTNIDIFGRRFPDLEESTKKAKRRRRGHARPLFDENKLINSFAYKTRGKNSVLVFIKQLRHEIARYLQVEGVGKRKKKFNFFGVTDGMERDAMVIMQRKLTRMLKK